MLNINFVPDDYVQGNESRRTNLLYLVLFGVVMAGLVGSFMTIKMRQRAVGTEEKFADEKMARAKEAIKQFEELQTKRKAILNTALTAADLLEPVPRSVLLASLTNNLPTGVSLLGLKIVQKEPKKTRTARVTNNKYKAAQAKKAAESGQKLSREKLLETHIDIEGIASDNIGVATYISNLSAPGGLLDNVALVESKEPRRFGRDTSGASRFRQFKLKAMLRKNVHITNEDIDRVRVKL